MLCAQPCIRSIMALLELDGEQSAKEVIQLYEQHYHMKELRLSPCYYLQLILILVMRLQW